MRCIRNPIPTKLGLAKVTKQRSSKRISALEDKQDSNEIDAIEALLEKIEECPSKKVREALKDSLNKENTTTDKDG